MAYTHGLGVSILIITCGPPTSIVGYTVQTSGSTDLLRSCQSIFEEAGVSWAHVGSNRPANRQMQDRLDTVYVPGGSILLLTSLGGPDIHLPDLVVLLELSWSKDESGVPNVLPHNTSFLVSNKSSKRRPALKIHVLCPYTMSIIHNTTQCNASPTTLFRLPPV